MDLSHNHKGINYHNTLDLKQLILCLPSSQWVFWKDSHSNYKGCNPTFASMLGMKKPQEIDGLKFRDLKYNTFPVQPEEGIVVEQTDQKVFDCSVSCEMIKTLYFNKHRLQYVMNCKVFPMLSDTNQVVGVFGIGNGSISTQHGSDNIFYLVNKQQIGHLLKSPKYLIKFGPIIASLTRREATCLLYTMKGKTAKETAVEMNIKPKTAQDYLKILKDKFGCYTRSQLIHIGFESNLLTEIQKYQFDVVDTKLEQTSRMGLLYDNDNRIFIKF